MPRRKRVVHEEESAPQTEETAHSEEEQGTLVAVENGKSTPSPEEVVAEVVVADPDEPPALLAVSQEVITEEPRLSEEERERLTFLENRVVESFLEAARALREIRDRRLYRETHGTFEAYTEERFGYGKRLAYYYIDAANITDNLTGESEHDVHVLPTSEAQVRPLKALEPERQREVWRKAVERAGGKAPSREVVAATVRDLVPRRDGAKAVSVAEGDVCLVGSTEDPLLRDRRGYWALVSSVEDDTVTLTLFDRNVSDVPKESLSVLQATEREKKRRQRLLANLRAVSESLPPEEALKPLLAHFGRLRRHTFTPFEEGLLSFLERYARKRGEASEEGDGAGNTPPKGEE
jgi:hypothetical protein